MNRPANPQRGPADAVASGAALPGGSFTSSTEGPPTAPSADFAPEDWDLLFRAVVDRLQALAEAQPHERPEVRRLGTPGSTRSVILECVAAFQQLHTTAMHLQAACAAPSQIGAASTTR